MSAIRINNNRTFQKTPKFGLQKRHDPLNSGLPRFLITTPNPYIYETSI